MAAVTTAIVVPTSARRGSAILSASSADLLKCCKCCAGQMGDVAYDAIKWASAISGLFEGR